MDDGLLISQEKSYSLSSSFLLCSYNIMSKILIDAGLVMEHSKTELFHFTRAHHPPNPSIDLSSVGGPVISPKPIWQYLGFYFDCRLNFNYHTHFYATKCLSTLSTMKMLGNSSRASSLSKNDFYIGPAFYPSPYMGFNCGSSRAPLL